jgi:hypothetical protein
VYQTLDADERKVCGQQLFKQITLNADKQKNSAQMIALQIESL